MSSAVISIKSAEAFQCMRTAGGHLARLFLELATVVVPGATTLQIDAFIESYLVQVNMVSQTKGYRGYRHASCISLNDEVVHGVPSARRIIADGDIVKVDVCAAWSGYCADMARCFLVGDKAQKYSNFAKAAQIALDNGIAAIRIGATIGDVSASIQETVESAGYSVVRDFAGHGIGKRMHEEPEILNYGTRGTGPVIEAGMAFALEPMIIMGSHGVFVDRDGWTVKTIDRTMASHAEDTVIVTDHGVEIVTRLL